MLKTTMQGYLGILCLLGVCIVCHAQTPTPPATTTAPNPFPEDHGMIFTTFHDYGSANAAQLRHLEIYAGYENFSGSVPGLRFDNPNIHLLSIDSDYKDKAIFAYDYHLRSIVVGHGYNIELNTSKMEFSVLHVGVSKGTVQVAYDWLSKTLYWSDYVYRWIVAAPTQKDKIDLDYYSIIADTHLDGPDGITLDPMEGYLFWTDNGLHPKIERSDMQGKNRHSIIYKNLVSPLTLEADIFEKRIFWVDSSMESILSANYDGTEIVQINRIPQSALLDLGVFREVVYVTDISNSYVYTLNKTRGPHLGKSESTSISIYPEVIYGISVYGSENQPQKTRDYCAEKKCEHMCVSTKTGAECICSVGYSLIQTSGKCEEAVSQYHKAIVTANDTHICLVDLRSFAHLAYEPVCIYSSIKQNKPSNSMTTTPGAPNRRKRQASTTAAPPLTTTGGHKTTHTASPATTTPRTTTTTTTLAPTAAPGDLIKMFDLDMENRLIYFVTASNSIYKRPIELPIENDAKDTILVASGTVTGLAFDKGDAENLYWCESDMGVVKVVNTATQSSREVRSGLVNPRNIVVLMDKRQLAVLVGNEGSMQIQTMNMDGSNLKTIVTTTDTISTFAYDREKQLFYYVSYPSLYSVKLDGSASQIAVNRVDRDIFHLVIYQNYVTWLFSASTYKHLVRTYDITTGTNVALGYFDEFVLNDMKVLDINLQDMAFVSPCAYENGNCEQICITKYTNDKMTPICECRLGYTLKADGKSCGTSVVDDNFILVVDWTNEEIQQINLQNNQINVIPDEPGVSYMGVFFDPDTKKVLYAAYSDTTITEMNLNGTGRKTFASLGNDGFAYRFDKDLGTKNLYFTSYNDEYIGVITPSGDHLILNDEFSILDSLIGIVVHPGKGWMYYVVVNYFSPYIGRCDMDGQNRVKLITGKHVENPDGLAIDYTRDHLYWSDADLDTIIRCDLNGDQCVTIVNMSTTYRDEEIRDMAIDGNYLYYSTYKKDHVVRVDLSSANYTRTIVGQSHGLGKLDTIAYYSSNNKNIQPVNKKCSARNGLGDCSTICLPTSTGRTCACERGIRLKDDQRTCSNVYQCDDIIKQTDAFGTYEVMFMDDCLRHLGDKCPFSCPINYRPLMNIPLTCTKVGWDFENQPLCKEVRCPATIKNGAVSQNCKREIGEKCDYTCNTGFQKSQQWAVCTKDNDGTYHVGDEELCTPMKCSETITNGALDSNCDRSVGSSCNYRCDKYYMPSDKKATAVCQTGGWSPSSLCIERECDVTSITNGQVTGTCGKKIGVACKFQCNQGYTNTTPVVVCNSDYTWHPATSCSSTKCSSNIPYGDIVIQGSCDLSVGKVCQYTCRYGNKTTDIQSLMCLSTGKWNVTDILCPADMSSTQAFGSKSSGSNISTAGVGVGVALLVLIIIALVVAIFFIIRRYRNTGSPYGTASFHQNGSSGPGIAIENPGYIASGRPTIEVKDEHPYSSVDPSQMQPVTFAGTSETDDGIFNPMYDKEPLPDVSHVDHDNAVLTKDSWLKEREKAKLEGK